MAWRIEFDAEAADEFRRLDHVVQQRVRRYLRDRIAAADDPQLFGKPLRGELAGVWRYRVGDYRLLCRIERPQRSVLVIRVGHRRSIYD